MSVFWLLPAGLGPAFFVCTRTLPEGGEEARGHYRVVARAKNQPGKTPRSQFGKTEPPRRPHGGRPQEPNPETDVGNGVESPPLDTRCQERPPADVPRFAAVVEPAGWRAVIAPGTTAPAPDRARAPIAAATDGTFPRQRAAAMFRPPLRRKARPATPGATATPAKPSGCAGAKCPPTLRKRSGHNRRVARDWNKTPAGHGRAGRWCWSDHCRAEYCAGSGFHCPRSVDSAAA